MKNGRGFRLRGENEERIYLRCRVSLSLQKRAAGCGGGSLPDYSEKEETVYPGAYRCGKNDFNNFPAVKAVGEGLGEKIFYLTAKTITRTVAEQAFTDSAAAGASDEVITLTAREKICFCEEAACNPEVCPYADGHFDRVNDAVFELITECDEISRRVIEQQAQKHRVCPFELALDTATWWIL